LVKWQVEEMSWHQIFYGIKFQSSCLRNFNPFIQTQKGDASTTTTTAAKSAAAKASTTTTTTAKAAAAKALAATTTVAAKATVLEASF
jgi:hypothetical protein